MDEKYHQWRFLQLFRSERGLARRAEGCEAARSSAVSGGIIAKTGNLLAYTL
jgi:hypothetical protein